MIPVWSAAWDKVASNATPAPRLPGVLVCGLGRDVAHAWPSTRTALDKSLRGFLRYHVLLFENDSTDGTPQLWRQWAEAPKRKGRVTVWSRALKRVPAAETTLAPGSGPLGNFTRWLAEYRNEYVDRGVMNTRRWTLDDYPLVWVLDTDIGREGWSPEAVWRAASLVSDGQWDALACTGENKYPNGTRVYDSLAFRDARFPEWPHELGESAYWQGARTRAVQNHLTRLARVTPEEVVPCQSAFGGMCLYNRALWVQSRARYAGERCGVACCEHTVLHDVMASFRTHTTATFRFGILRSWRVPKGSHGYGGAGTA